MMGRYDHFVGIMDDVSVFRRALSPEDVFKLHESGVSFEYPQYTQASLYAANQEPIHVDMGVTDNRFHSVRLDLDSDGTLRFYWDGKILGHSIEPSFSYGR